MKRLVVGDKAVLDCWGVPIPVVVIEDRGDIGVGGRQLVRIRLEEDEAREFEWPAEELSSVCEGRK